MNFLIMYFMLILIKNSSAEKQYTQKSQEISANLSAKETELRNKQNSIKYYENLLESIKKDMNAFLYDFINYNSQESRLKIQYDQKIANIKPEYIRSDWKNDTRHSLHPIYSLIDAKNDIEIKIIGNALHQARQNSKASEQAFLKFKAEYNDVNQKIVTLKKEENNVKQTIENIKKDFEEYKKKISLPKI